MKTNGFICSGCDRQVQSHLIKNHISNCTKYNSNAFYLAKVKGFSERDDINQLKFLSQQLGLARQYLQNIIAKKKRSSVNQDDIDIFQMPNGKINNQVFNKPYKSQFFVGDDASKSNKSFPQFKDKKKQQPVNNKMDVQDSYDKMKMQEPKNKMRMDQQQPKMGMKSDKKNMMIQLEQQDIMQYDNPQIVKCPLCKNKFYSSYNIDKLEYIEECWHLVCKKCLKQYILNQFVSSDGFPKCPLPQCSNKLPQHQSKAILGDRFEILQDKVMRKNSNFNIVQCIKCLSQYDFAPGNPNDAPKKDQSGKAIKSEHAILFAEQRFVCPRPNCKTQQCKQCKASPYHLGMDCKQFKSRALMLKCRYCNNPITDKNLGNSHEPALSDICNSKDCQQLARTACIKILPCSHPCSGVKNQKKCLPCLKEGCCQHEPALAGQTGDDYCSICFVEGLSSAPSIQCGCGHIFHMKCLKKRYQIKWLTPRILFNFCVCPLCKKWIEVPPQSQLYDVVNKMKELHAQIQKMSFQRLKFQELEKDQKLTNKESIYFNKPKQYAMAIYAYFMCFKCKNPYFGGRKNCAQVMNNAQNVQGYDPKELVCPKCCDIPIQNCPKHGNDFIQFKCKFCCSTAQWFCWGNTHFCQPCHKRQCNGDYVSKYTKDQLPKCQGPGKCPIGGNHGQNGQQKMLGCAICRNYKQNSKNF